MPAPLSVFYSYLSYECGQQSDSPVHTRAVAIIFPSLKEWAASVNFECRSYNVLNLSKDFKQLVGKKESGVTKKLAFGPDKVCAYSIQWVELEAYLRLSGLFDTKEEEARLAKCEAFTLGQHERLGAGSLIATLPPDLAQMILDRV